MFNRKMRAWHKLEEKMYEVAKIDFKKSTISLSTLAWEKDNEVNLRDVKVMEESGLNDEKGFNTFEDDLISFEGEICVLQYGHYGHIVEGTNKFGWHLYSQRFGNFPYLGGGVKVGNFYENNRLIKEQYDVT